MYFLLKKFLIKSSILSSKGALITCFLFTPIALADCNSNESATTPSSDFTVHNDGTVTHKTTALMWKVCSNGQMWVAGVCSGSTTNHTWDQALQAPETLNGSGGFPLSGVGMSYSDWRLPNRKELKSIVELQCYNPAINEEIFPNTASSFYWSSSPVANSNDYAWGEHFDDVHGNTNYRNRSHPVRLVRSGQ